MSITYSRPTHQWNGRELFFSGALPIFATALFFTLNVLRISELHQLPSLVGIGASAGGLQALEAFFGAIPEDTGLAFVVVQHLSPHVESELARLLSRTTTMPVIELTENVMPRANHVYVNSPLSDVRVERELRLSDRDVEARGSFLSIDNFLISLANSHGPEAFAIILSGMGSDGSRGIKEIKERGGFVLVQSPLSAEFEGMPDAAIRQRVADYIDTPEGLAQQLVNICRIRREHVLRPEITEEETYGPLWRELFALIEAERSINFVNYRPSTLVRRLEKRMLLRQCPRMEDYLELVQHDREELTTLAASFLIGVTAFFRDEPAFEEIWREVIPALFRSGDGIRPIRIWMPSCSTGEEVYSMAMLLERYKEENKNKREYRIFASDVDRQAIQTATLGLYHESSMVNVPANLLGRYFFHRRNGYEATQWLKEKILFAVQNLLTDPPFIHIDLVVCRNFLIYVNNEAQEQIIGNFHFSLRPGGFLFLGPSESLGHHRQSFITVSQRWKIFSSRPEISAPAPRTGKLPSSDMLIGQNSRPAESVKYSSDQNAEAVPFPPASSEPTMDDHFAQLLAARYAPPGLFVNHEYDIVYIHGDLDNLLHFPRRHARLNLDTVLNEEASILIRAGVDAAYSSSKTGQFSELPISNAQGERQMVRVKIYPPEREGPRDGLVLVEFSEQRAVEGDFQEIPALIPDEIMREQIKVLEEELLRARSQARRLLNELEATNEELQTSNRELMASNEEMQSTNEELQSVNEELYTVNSEMERKNLALNAAHNDINHLLESTQIGTIFLDQKLNIRRFTPSIRRQFDLHLTDIGRPLSAFKGSFSSINLLEIGKQVLRQGIRFEQEVTNDKGNNYLLRILPYRTADDNPDGIVVTFIGIQELVEARTQLRDTARKYEAVFKYSTDTVLVLTDTGRITEINRPLAEEEPEMLNGGYFTELLANDQQRAEFNQIFRSVLDEQTSQSGEFIITGHRGKVEFHYAINFIPVMLSRTDTRNTPETGGRTMLMVRDITEEVKDREATAQLLSEYRAIIEETDSQAGIMDVEGNILSLNRTATPQMAVEDFISANVCDFLTESGTKKFRMSIARLKSGSFYERVEYTEEDLEASYPERYSLVDYRPLYVNGELALITVNNALDTEEQKGNAISD